MPSPTKTAQDVFRAATSPNSIRPLTAYDQSRLARWQRENFGPQPLVNMALGVAEEAGELCHAVLKNAQGIRGMSDPEAFLEAAGDAIADTAIYLMQLSTSLGLDFGTLVHQTIADVTQRSWKTNPDTGTQPTEEETTHDA